MWRKNKEMHIVKVKFSHHRPEQALGDPEGEGFRIFHDFWHKGGKVITLMHWPSLPPRVSWYSFLKAESTPGHMVPSIATEKSPATPLGIDPSTLQLVEQCLNHYATPGPKYTQ
jgi:hypothetical protein